MDEKEIKERIIFPLDVPDRTEALAWVRRLGGEVGVFKIGLELFTAEGPEIVRAVKEESGARIFLDLKFHDIPVTVERAVARALDLKVDLLTVHALAGRAALRAAALAAEGGLKILVVTVLTSLTRADLMEVGLSAELVRDIRELTLKMASLARISGCHGIVCSAKEVSAVKEAFPRLLTVVPGVRPAWASQDDQVRVATPAEAAVAGADYLVIGRPIRQAPDPREAVKKIVSEILKGLEEA
ncbi:orotidine-5'-phosphate decarboxylase [Thermosulfuriphilus ammonigenes]|uniref:Orotidine 5'-phosphate decarboxylase n=1 Tax=Thermosulfuriphilus ammonigenes TaxID=1936021 RepID=A0A6G7PXB3_9BACT|nr:orotidine-5'-phosphate decarboxylase [Thermosulfuriphilus ammonigenes]MBA2847742.1 orotidine-5'-phosphate decarboxylase [Thermosulfuriphilus ammonigenes]QIJ72053.1 orotidine-5'-phosphate decarboxylase [Thermosulfuriphilus ammonigenes]